ncbi:MAG: SAM-dependent chlorinase/fluorinase [Ignavibacteria bacterium]|nr:SAM-dependent chlorinase/fluorinase [Ignavibacteria bacterium]
MMRSSTRKRTHTIALISDFGLQDHYVATLKSVILSLSPLANIIDISNSIEPGNVNQAAYVLWSAYGTFPPGTVFVAVVDPGVGTNRAIIALHADDHLFIAPDNGILKYILGMTKVREIRRVNNRELMREPICATFHGRDIIAPVAASFAEGIQMRTVGPLFQPETKPAKFVGVRTFDIKQIDGEIIHIDVFGNLVTNFYMDDYFDRGEEIKILMKKTSIGQFYRTYGYAPPDKPFGYVGSSGLMEIALKNKSAAKILKIDVGTKLTLTIK